MPNQARLTLNSLDLIYYTFIFFWAKLGMFCVRISPNLLNQPIKCFFDLLRSCFSNRPNWNMQWILECLLILINFYWVFTRVYDPLARRAREAFQEELRSIRGLWQDPWCLGGYFNSVKLPGEQSKALKLSSTMRSFWEVVRQCTIISVIYFSFFFLIVLWVPLACIYIPKSNVYY